MTYVQVFLATAFALFLVTFVATMLYVRRRGYEPEGVMTDVKAWDAAVTTAASLLWLAVMLLYIFDARSAVWFGRIPILDGPIAQGLGVMACTLAGVCIVWGEVSLGRSFRVALPESRQPLVTRGIYRFIRNPLALSADLLALGVLLLAPSWLALISLALNVAGYEWKIRIEEAYLREAHGTTYTAYCAQTSRYLPCLFS
jgi:protein-S-isoprenylcysteine O-methyltransferase Ste14